MTLSEHFNDFVNNSISFYCSTVNLLKQVDNNKILESCIHHDAMMY